MTIIWHNPRCSKSRQTLALLQERGVEPQVRLYLDDPPDVATLRDVLGKLGLSARELVRAKEAREAGLNLKTATEEEVLQAMVDHPRLIERPVVIQGERAVLGRPPEQVLTLLE